MQVFKTALFRALIAMVAGGLMVLYREQMVTWLTICIGIMFFISGIASIIAYYAGKKKYDKVVIGEEDEMQTAVIAKPAPPVVGLGSLILGLILILMPTEFTNLLVYIFAGLIILGALGEYISLVSTIRTIKDYKVILRESTVDENESIETPRCGFIYWVIPTLLFLFGLYAILDPVAIKSSPFLFIGVAMIIYGLSEVINAIKFHNIHKEIANMTHNDIKAIEEVDSEK